MKNWSGCGHLVSFFSDPSLSKYTLLNYLYLFCYCKREMELTSVWLLYYSHQSRLLLDLFVYPSTVLLYLNHIIFSSGFHNKVFIYDCRPLIMHTQSYNGKHLLLQGYIYLSIFFFVMDQKHWGPFKGEVQPSTALSLQFLHYLKLQDKLEKLNILRMWNLETSLRHSRCVTLLAWGMS